MQIDTVNGFFKYSDTEGARFILRDGTLKFSVASKFNDPFDSVIDTLFGYDPIEKLPELQRAQIDILMSDESFPSFATNQYQQFVTWMRSALSSVNEVEKEKLRQAFCAEPPDSIWDKERLRTVETETLADVQGLLSADAIFCASIACDNQLLWSHYAQDHKGVALEFAPDVEKDSVLRLMTSVTYSDDRPILYKSPKDFLHKSMFQKNSDVIQEFVRNVMLTKNTRWSYEQEVRMYIPSYVRKDQTYRLVEYHPNELKAVYLGCKIELSDAKELVKLAHSRNKNVSVLRMEMGKSNYELKPVQVDIGQYL